MEVVGLKQVGGREWKEVSGFGIYFEGRTNEDFRMTLMLGEKGGRGW